MTPADNPVVLNAVAGDVDSWLEMTPMQGFLRVRLTLEENMTSKKHIAMVALIINLGAAGIYAQQQPVKMAFSGTSENSNFNLAAGAGSSEDNYAGEGTLGAFTFRDLAAELPSSSPPSTCSGPNMLYSVRMVTTGVFRFRDGSLLNVNLIQGSDCIDLAAQQAHCTIIFKITGGTGRFEKASGILAFSEIVKPALADISGMPVFYTSTGTFTGMISGVAAQAEPQGRQQ